MKKLILPLLLYSSLFSEGLNTGSLIDANAVPMFSTCTDIAKIANNKPVLLFALTQVSAESGSAAYAIKGPVDIDVKTGTISYKVYNSLTNDVAETPTFVNHFCTDVDPDVVKQEVTQATQSIKTELDNLYGNVDTIYNEAKASSQQQSGGKTDSDVLGQAMSGNVDAAKADENNVSHYNNTSTTQSQSSTSSPQLGFMAKINSVNNQLQTLVFFGVVLVSMIGLGAGYITKKLQKMQDHEDYVSRFGLGIVMWFLLFAPANTYKYDNGEISQTRMQAVWSWMLNEGTGVANQLAGAAHHQQMRYTIEKSGGKEIENQIASAVQEKVALNNVQPAYESILNQCIQSYRVNDLSMALGDSKSGGKRYFPANEAQVSSGSEDVYSRYLQSTIDQNSIYMSLTTCGKAEQEYKDLVVKKQQLQEKIQNANNTKFGEKYTSASKQLVRDTTKAGWIGIAMLPVQHFIAKGTGNKVESQIHPAENLPPLEKKKCSDISSTLDKIGCYAETAFDYIDPTNTIQAVKTLSLDNFLQSIAQRATMYMVPGVAQVGTFIFNENETLGNMIEKIPVVGNFIPAKWAAGILSFYISTDLGIIIINNLPFLALVPVISIVIALYFAEVFLYSITIPYVAAYAFSRDQWGHLVKHAVRGIMIALKPAMIVISVYTALYVSDKITSISTEMINKQTAMLIANDAQQHPTVSIADSIKNSFAKIQSTPSINGTAVSNGNGFIDNAMSGVEYLSGKFTVYIIQGLLFIIMAVVQVFIVVKIIVSGPAMIMEMFGVRETDMASQMTESIASRGQKYEGGI